LSSGDYCHEEESRVLAGAQDSGARTRKSGRRGIESESQVGKSGSRVGSGRSRKSVPSRCQAEPRAEPEPEPRAGAGARWGAGAKPKPRKAGAKAGARCEAGARCRLFTLFRPASQRIVDLQLQPDLGRLPDLERVPAGQSRLAQALPLPNGLANCPLCEFQQDFPRLRCPPSPHTPGTSP
jgi:hypothetical protein